MPLKLLPQGFSNGQGLWHYLYSTHQVKHGYFYVLIQMHLARPNGLPLKQGFCWCWCVGLRNYHCSIPRSSIVVDKKKNATWRGKKTYNKEIVSDCNLLQSSGCSVLKKQTKTNSYTDNYQNNSFLTCIFLNQICCVKQTPIRYPKLLKL